MRKIVSISILICFFITGQMGEYPVYAQVDPMPFMPAPGIMVNLSPEFTPAYLKGIVIHPENALKFDFIIYKGDTPLSDTQKREEYTKLTKYFLASLAIPDTDQWVNLSPYEKDRIIKDDFGKTEMGRDLLAQDYLLKQITASLIYPENNLGKQFWNKVYAQAQEQYGTTNIPVNTFNKVWILPDNALIYEKGNAAYILKNHLRVMLEEDYVSLQKHSGIQSTPANKTHTIASKIVKEIVLPELQREVNEDKNFAALRQVYSGMLLATWFKRTLKQSLLGQIYANKAKIRGIDQNPRTNEKIYEKYLQAYKKGVFNFIKEDVDKYTNERVPKKYFSGGTADYAMAQAELGYDPAQITYSLDFSQKSQIKNEMNHNDDAMVALNETNPAMGGTVLTRLALLNLTRQHLISELESAQTDGMYPPELGRIRLRLAKIDREIAGLTKKSAKKAGEAQRTTGQEDAAMIRDQSQDNQLIGLMFEVSDVADVAIKGGKVHVILKKTLRNKLPALERYLRILVYISYGEEAVKSSFDKQNGVIDFEVIPEQTFKEQLQKKVSELMPNEEVTVRITSMTDFRGHKTHEIDIIPSKSSRERGSELALIAAYIDDFLKNYFPNLVEIQTNPYQISFQVLSIANKAMATHKQVSNENAAMNTAQITKFALMVTAAVGAPLLLYDFGTQILNPDFPLSADDFESSFKHLIIFGGTIIGGMLPIWSAQDEAMMPQERLTTDDALRIISKLFTEKELDDTWDKQRKFNKGGLLLLIPNKNFMASVWLPHFQQIMQEKGLLPKDFMREITEDKLDEKTIRFLKAPLSWGGNIRSQNEEKEGMDRDALKKKLFDRIQTLAASGNHQLTVILGGTLYQEIANVTDILKEILEKVARENGITNPVEVNDWIKNWQVRIRAISLNTTYLFNMKQSIDSSGDFFQMKWVQLEYMDLLDQKQWPRLIQDPADLLIVSKSLYLGKWSFMMVGNLDKDRNIAFLNNVNTFVKSKAIFVTETPRKDPIKEGFEPAPIPLGFSAVMTNEGHRSGVYTKNAAMNPQERLEHFLSNAASVWASIQEKTKQITEDLSLSEKALADNRMGFEIPRGQDKPFYGIEAALKSKAYEEYFESVQDAIAEVLGVKEELQSKRSLRKATLGKKALHDDYEFIHTSSAEFLPPGGQHVTLVSNVMQGWDEADAVANDLQNDTKDIHPFVIESVGPQLMPNFAVTISLTTQDPQALLVKERGLARAKARNPQGASMPPFFHSSVAYITNATQEQLLKINKRLEELRRSAPHINIKIDELNVEKGSIGRKEIQEYGPIVKLHDAAMKDILNPSGWDMPNVQIERMNEDFLNWVESGGMDEEDRLLLGEILSGDQVRLKRLVDTTKGKVAIKNEDDFEGINGRSVYLTLKKPFPNSFGDIHMLRLKGVRPIIQNGKITYHKGKGRANYRVVVDQEGNLSNNPVRENVQGSQKHYNLEFDLMKEGQEGLGFLTDFPIASGFWKGIDDNGVSVGFTIDGMRGRDLRLLNPLFGDQSYFDVVNGDKFSLALKTREQIFSQLGKSLRAFHRAGFFHGFPHLQNIGVEFDREDKVRIILRDLETGRFRKNLDGDLEKQEATYRLLDIHMIISRMISDGFYLRFKDLMKTNGLQLISHFWMGYLETNNHEDSKVEEMISVSTNHDFINLRNSVKSNGQVIINKSPESVQKAWNELYEISKSDTTKIGIDGQNAAMNISSIQLEAAVQAFEKSIGQATGDEDVLQAASTLNIALKMKGLSQKEIDSTIQRVQGILIRHSYAALRTNEEFVLFKIIPGGIRTFRSLWTSTPQNFLLVRNLNPVSINFKNAGWSASPRIKFANNVYGVSVSEIEKEVDGQIMPLLRQPGRLMYQSRNSRQRLLAQLSSRAMGKYLSSLIGTEQDKRQKIIEDMIEAQINGIDEALNPNVIKDIRDIFDKNPELIEIYQVLMAHFNNIMRGDTWLSFAILIEMVGKYQPPEYDPYAFGLNKPLKKAEKLVAGSTESIVDFYKSVWRRYMQGDHNMGTLIPLASASLERIADNFDEAMTTGGQDTAKIIQGPGGIDMNSANLAMTIKRDGNGIPIISQQDLAQLSNIEGLDPEILSIKPANQTSVFAEL